MWPSETDIKVPNNIGELNEMDQSARWAGDLDPKFGKQFKKEFDGKLIL
jgi:hypothetical protein